MAKYQIVFWVLVPLCFFGCVPSVSHLQPVSLGGVSTPVSQAADIDKRVIENAKTVQTVGAAPQAPITLAMVKDSTQIEALLETAKLQISLDEIKIQAATDQANKNADNALNEHTKFLKADGLLWKWRIMFFGLVAFVVAFFIARQYFPFLKIF